MASAGARVEGGHHAPLLPAARREGRAQHQVRRAVSVHVGRQEPPAQVAVRVLGMEAACPHLGGHVQPQASPAKGTYLAGDGDVGGLGQFSSLGAEVDVHRALARTSRAAVRSGEQEDQAVPSVRPTGRLP